MKLIFLFVITLSFLSCNETAPSEDIGNSEIVNNSIDTALVKIENKLSNWFEAENFARSYTYCWVLNNDTLDFSIGVTESISDSSLVLRFSHRKPILFSNAMEKLDSCLPMIKQDFELNKLRSIYFEPPIFYKDMTIELSKSYKSQFGQKVIKHNELNKFLKESWLDKRIGVFLKQFNKSTRRYNVEKFGLLKKEDYYEYIPNMDLNDHPSFSIHGMGVSVYLNENI